MSLASATQNRSEYDGLREPYWGLGGPVMPSWLSCAVQSQTKWDSDASVAGTKDRSEVVDA